MTEVNDSWFWISTDILIDIYPMNNYFSFPFIGNTSILCNTLEGVYYGI